MEPGFFRINQRLTGKLPSGNPKEANCAMMDFCAFVYFYGFSVFAKQSMS
jgi:hypothetical protein